jgi:hypothetical protein
MLDYRVFPDFEVRNSLGTLGNKGKETGYTVSARTIGLDGWTFDLRLR